MNTNTLRFGVARAAVFSVLIAAAAIYAGSARADGVVPQRPSAELTAALRAELQGELKTALAAELAQTATQHTATMLAALRESRVDLLSKVAASASVAPRGFVLVMPAALAQPTL